MTTAAIGMQVISEVTETVFACIAVTETCIINRLSTKNMSNLVRTAQKDLANVNVIAASGLASFAF